MKVNLCMNAKEFQYISPPGLVCMFACDLPDLVTCLSAHLSANLGSLRCGQPP